MQTARSTALLAASSVRDVPRRRSAPDYLAVQRCTVHKHRNLLASAPERLHAEIGADYNDMIYAATPEEIEARRKAFIRKWRLKHRAVADSLEEAGDLWKRKTLLFLPPALRNGLSDRRGGAEYLHKNLILESSSDPQNTTVRSKETTQWTNLNI